MTGAMTGAMAPETAARGAAMTRGDRTDMPAPEEKGNIGVTLMTLAATIESRVDADPEVSYTARLLQGNEDSLLKKIGEEGCEVVMAAKDKDHDHLRYEAGDLVYHLLVVLQRYGVTLAELADELNGRMK
jgi:phosphoribosyl-ATP pyrophosphohydrolase